ncbi:fatty acyl-CoA reductase [Angomonas deanei]|nr:fatty acyl-CoA reductase [Angomonas deanei]|eukprot:EPY42410.1 fatty acyl-CoA reductase [Angomonas deanei]
MNTLGGLRVLSLARHMHKLEAMVHVSTCYVNYPRHGRENVNEEKIYPLDCDPEAMVKNILGMQPAEVEEVSRTLLKQYGFSNTYTFTKSLGERLILRYRNDVPLVIVRPSIIGASYKEPMPGWVDALTAAGGLMLTAALGVVREVVVKKECIADVVPVDCVVNIILKALFKTQQYYRHERQLAPPAEHASPAAAPSAPQPVGITLNVKSSTPSNAMVPPTATATTEATPTGFSEPSVRLHNPTTGEDLPLIYQACVTAGGYGPSWERLTNSLRRFMATSNKPHPKGLSKCDITLTDSQAYFYLRYYLLRYTPYLLTQALVSLPEPIGSPKKAKMVEKWGRAVRRSLLLNKEFKDFILVEWIYDNANSKSLDVGLDEVSQRKFAYDPSSIQWSYYTQLYTYGIFKHIVRETGALQCPTAPPSPTDIFDKAAKM